MSYIDLKIKTSELDRSEHYKYDDRHRPGLTDTSLRSL